MFSTAALSSRALARASRQTIHPVARRRYATDYEKRTQETLKTSSRLTWLTTTAAVGAAALYYTTSSSSTPANNSSASTSSAPSASKPTSDDLSSHASESTPGHRHEFEYASDAPKPVEDRHGDTVSKHSIAAHKNQSKLRVGKFSGEEFDNHELEHTPGKPGADFEKRK